LNPISSVWDSLKLRAELSCAGNCQVALLAGFCVSCLIVLATYFSSPASLSLSLIYLEKYLMFATDTPPTRPTSNNTLNTNLRAAPGLTASYFTGTELDQGQVGRNLAFSRVDSNINFQWGQGAPDARLTSDRYSVRWTGQVTARFSENYTFYTNADDGIRLWVNGQLMVNDWSLHGAREVASSRTIALVAGQAYDIKVEYFENTGLSSAQILWSSTSQTKSVIDAAAFSQPVAPPRPVASTPGLVATYFNGTNFQQQALQRLDTNVDFAWGTGSPEARVNANQFSVRWEGFVVADYTDNYTFFTQADDGIRLWVNDQLVINNWQLQGVTERSTAPIALVGGQAAKIKLEYYENTGGATARLLWSSSNQSKQAISQSNLFSLTNQAPTLSLPTAPQTVATSQNLAIAGIRVADPDSGGAPISVTLRVARGTLQVNAVASGGVSAANITNNGTAVVVLTGTLAQINATLASSNGLLYRSNSGFTGLDSLEIIANDQGNSGFGGPKSTTQALNINVSGTNFPLGNNLTGVVDWSTAWPFVDLFKQARPWISNAVGRGWDQGGPLNLTADGWVASLAENQFADTVLLNDRRYWPSGDYTLLYDGEGEMEFLFGHATIRSQSPGRMVVNVPPAPDGAVFLRIKKTNVNNPIRNLRFIMPGFEATYQTQPFHPLFVERQSVFKTLRFMDWGVTNGSKVVNWSDRTTLGAGPGSRERGASLEDMINLANQMNIDPWFTIPHQASDDYVRQFATMVRDRLKPTLKARIEYSNEVWNYAFSQTAYARDQGVARNLASTPHESMLRFYSQRSVEVFNIWDQVFGSSARSRVVRVLATQSVSPWSSEAVLSWRNAYQSVDELAIAPYFYGGTMSDPAYAATTAALTVDQAIDQILANMRTVNRSQMVDQAKVASKYNLTLSAYEGGQHLTTNQFPMGAQRTAIYNLFLNVNRSPRMYDVYTEYLTQWRDVLASNRDPVTNALKPVRSGTFANFASGGGPSDFGYWGVLEYQTQDPQTAPKYRALVDFARNNPA
jgi:hypothetical protein